VTDNGSGNARGLVTLNVTPLKLAMTISWISDPRFRGELPSFLHQRMSVFPFRRAGGKYPRIKSGQRQGEANVSPGQIGVMIFCTTPP
jgi:hypothetical protein